jgi:ATP-dependent DNA helicase PIF1
MKLKCDLIIQNLNKQISTNQEKLYKSAIIGLYRPKLYDENPTSTCCYDEEEANDKTAIILTIETTDHNLKYKLKRIETYTKYIKEGKATLKLIDENIFLLISNTPSLTLTNFISFLNLKLVKSNVLQARTKSSNDLEKCSKNKEETSTQKYVNKLLNKVQCNLGTNALTNISPLTEKEISDVMKARQDFKVKTESPIRATGSQNPGKSRLFRSQSTNCLSPSTSTQKASQKLYKSLSSSDLNMVQLTDEQKYVLKLIKSGKSLFFTGSGGSGKSFLINIIKKSLPTEACFVTASTGVAASLINGITIHAFAGFTLSSETANTNNNGGGESGVSREGKFCTALNRVLNSREKMTNWKKCQHLIIDEISMIDAEYFDCLDYVARAIKNQPELPMGGIQVILSGDFLQLPPVSKYNEEKKKFCFQVK